MRTLRLVGVMSGTSLDAVDCAACLCHPDRIELDRWWSRPFPRALRQRLQELAAGGGTGWDLARAHHELGRFYAEAVAGGLGRWRADGVGLHGQTIFHQPPPAAPATLQIGEPAWVAARLRVPVVANFRAGDLAVGGQGAPLATLFHRAAFARRGEFVAVHNLGGISNVTALDWSGRRREPWVAAFDTGPANLLLDLAARRASGGRARCDWNGRLARRGRIEPGLLRRCLAHRFLGRPPPKSTGREEFGEAFLDRLLRRGGGALPAADLLATLTEFTARSVALNYRLFLRRPAGWPARVVLAGGGAANPFLRERLEAAWADAVGPLQVGTSAELGWPLPAVEPGAFAWLAALRLWGRPGHLPATTGARRPALLGQRVDP
ncbi:MAG: anhydro-N-acetylmuramic acid kinase [Verrucomicrobiota bacterium]